MNAINTSRQQLDGFQRDFDALRQEVAKVVVGLSGVIDNVLIAAIAGGHVLLEGPPGLGKTVLVRTLAEAVDLSFQRIQFTPDLMPSDLIGTFVVMENAQGRRTFEFQQGPLFANLVLADQINRGLPKTQSAMLQAMEGETINVGHEQFRLPQPFFVLATQNPLDSEGAFPLPEPEIDRFFFKLSVAAAGRLPDREDFGADDRGRPAAGQADRRRQAAAGDAEPGPIDFPWPGASPSGRGADGGEQSGPSAGAGADQAIRPLRQQSARRRRSCWRRRFAPRPPDATPPTATTSWRRSIRRCGTGWR